MNFVKSNTKRGWEKLPDGRKNKPEYAERAVLEAMVNHFIHRDYTVMGSEVHLDIYDDRLILTSPGGMYNGILIQDLDIANEFNRLRAFNKARLKKHAKIFGYIRKKTYLCKRKIKNEAP